jgi:hypothetical protein
MNVCILIGRQAGHLTLASNTIYAMFATSLLKAPCAEVKFMELNTAFVFVIKTGVSAFYMLIDNHPDWLAQDSTVVTTSSSCAQVGSLLGVWCRGAFVAHGNVRAHRSLAGLYLVRHWQRGATDTSWTSDRVA